MQLKRGCPRQAEQASGPNNPAPMLFVVLPAVPLAWPYAWRIPMSFYSRRILLAAMLTVVAGASVSAAEKPKEIRIDWATYNPVSMLLKEKGYLERELAKDNITVRWVQTVSSSNALQFLNAGSIDFGSSAGSAALVAKINGNPIK